MTSSLLLTVDDGVATVTLDAPARRNAFDAAMVDELVEVFDRIEADESVHAVVVTGAAPAFCAGADLSHLLAAGAADEAGRRAGLLHIYEGFLRVGRCPLPTIAAVNGAAVGAGVNLALACDVRLAGRSARFDTRFLALGLHPGGGHTWMLERAVGPQAAAAMVLFGEVLSGEEAAAAGLAWRCVPDDELLDAAVALASRATRAPQAVLRDVKGTFATMAGVHAHGEAVEVELGPQVRSLARPGVRERLTARRPPR